ncbi:MAG: hypothetical protein IJB89_10340 [Akkermansia sp.]|nr:hypothetical protein [Akkermansia sp.]
MKALSLLLSALWVLCSLTQPASALGSSMWTTSILAKRGILTLEEYNEAYYFKHEDDSDLALQPLQSIKIGSTNWYKITGKKKSTSTISEDANKYLKNLFETGLLEDVKKLPHESKSSWDDILKAKAIVLNTVASDPIRPNDCAQSTCDHPKYNPFWSVSTEEKEQSSDIYIQRLTCVVDTMAKKERWCFEDGGLESSDASLRTTLVHEMGHQYVLANYPDLHRHHSDPNQSDPELVDKLVIMCQEAFAVYTEYSYLQQLAKKGEIANFNFKDFLDDACNKAQAVQACYKSLYNVDLAYIYYFLCGLDWDGEPDESGCPPFNYLKLEKIANLCNKIRNNNLDISDIVDIKIKDFPLPIELLKDYMPDKTKKKLKITSTLSRTNRILQLNNQLAAKYKIDDFADLQTIAAKTPTNMTVDQYRAEYKKVSPDIRKQTFQVMLEYLSANQYMK